MAVTTIWNILNNDVEELNIKRGIIIPMIQRDYAQGRNTNETKEIRTIFLDKILSSILSVKINNGNPLELDFIYGYIEAEAFIPLDGQQRLTTLYLIHWYLAFKEGILKDHEGSLSRFSYQTRNSSATFFTKLNSGLTVEDHNEIFDKNSTFTNVIKDKNWFFINWKYDLTIKSALQMLDDLHRIFNGTEIKLSDIISETNPPIVFNFLDIQNFGLSDDLYIKMNSRGKPLTKFENLKAELGKFIKLSNFNSNYDYKLKHSSGHKKVDVETYFSTKVDTSWSDYFWNIRNIETHLFDDKMLNLLAYISLGKIISLNTVLYEKTLKELESKAQNLSFHLFKKLEMLNENSIITYINILDVLISEEPKIQTYLNDSTYLDKNLIIKSAFLSDFKANYEQRIFFYAIFSLLLKTIDNIKIDELLKWDRLIHNLVVNSSYNSPRDYRNTIETINKLHRLYSGDIYSDFVSNVNSGFDGQQIKEEKLKIELITRSEVWKRLILTAEGHNYLKGQIVFILSFCDLFEKYNDKYITTHNEEQLTKELQLHYSTAEQYYLKFEKIFTNTGLKNYEDERFRRALLVKGDYLLYSTNYSLIVDSHRDVSWKRLLRESGNTSKRFWQTKAKFVKELFDDLDLLDIDNSLLDVIKLHEIKDWRKDFIDYPFIIKSSKEKYIKMFDNGDIYPLRKSKYYKELDPEVKCLIIKNMLIEKGFRENEIFTDYIYGSDQYGIVGLKNKKPKITYNANSNRKFSIQQKDVASVSFDELEETVEYLVENFL